MGLRGQRRSEALWRGERQRADFDRFVAGSAEGLVRTGYLLTGDLWEAEDLVQECLLRVAKRWPRVRRMGNPQAYARRTLVNLVLDGRSARVRRGEELGREIPERRDESEGIDAFLARTDELTGALAALTARQRAMVVLRYFEDLSERQVAEALECSVGNVKSTTSRALEILRGEMRSQEPSAEASASAVCEEKEHCHD